MCTFLIKAESSEIIDKFLREYTDDNNMIEQECQFTCPEYENLVGFSLPSKFYTIKFTTEATLIYRDVVFLDTNANSMEYDRDTEYDNKFIIPVDGGLLRNLEKDEMFANIIFMMFG
jgi:hypothetical protein